MERRADIFSDEMDDTLLEIKHRPSHSGSMSPGDL